MSEAVGVLFVIDELQALGGAERNLVRMLQTLPRDRYRPYVLTFRINRGIDAFRTLPCPLEVYPVHNLYGINAIRYAPRLLRLLRRERIRIVHTFFETSDLWAGPISKFGAKAKLISSRRDLGIQRNARLNLLYRLMGGLFDEIQVVSDQVAEYVIAADRVPRSRVVTVPNGIELKNVPARGSGAALSERLGLPDGRPIVTTVSNVRRVKGIDVLLRAAAEVCRRRPETLFVIAGRVLEAGYQAELDCLSTELGIGSNVCFAGLVEEPLQLLAQTDVFVLPSRSEGMSNALLEAMASSVPAVATAVGGNLQLIEDGVTGFLTPVEDAAAAAARILDLLDDPARARRMGAAARAVVERQYSAEAVVTLLMRRYGMLLRQS